MRHLSGDAIHLLTGVLIDLLRLMGIQSTCLMQQAHGMQQRIIGFIRLNFGFAKIGCRHISASVSIPPNGTQVLECRLR